jgi:RNA polymerase sigma factor (TIGR02999 family)
VKLYRLQSSTLQLLLAAVGSRGSNRGIDMEVGDSVTQWLHLWRDGDQEAIERVTELVYQDLRRLAAYHLGGESNANTMQPTALVHEAYLRVSSIRNVDWKGRGHFISVVTQIMRRILVDHARARKAAKRDSSAMDPVTMLRDAGGQLDILVIDQALNRMATRHPRCSQVVELRFFGDLEFQEIAEVMDISLATVERDWRFARAWLQEKLQEKLQDKPPDDRIGP